MTIAQTFRSPCDFAHQMPNKIAEFIDIEKDLKRPFREDSITDLILASFLKLPPRQVLILTPSEAQTGSDFDLVITQSDAKDMVHYRIQAKRLTLSRGPVWGSSYYRCIDHRIKSIKALQVDVLCASSQCIPLYAFYNHGRIVTASANKIPGIVLADALIIQKLIHGALPGFKRISNLEAFFFPLATILCSSDRKSVVATPRESELRVREAIAKTREAMLKLPLTAEFGIFKEPDPISRANEHDETLRITVLKAVRDGIARERSIISSPSVRRPCVTLIGAVSSSVGA
ncbi:MAG: DUF6615 family protein [Methylocystis sp.]|uniref:DUF6615 family protein n=1 Tax=Methylocystis sp. TaxID=1911079 RepID=UPI003D0EDCE6